MLVPPSCFRKKAGGTDKTVGAKAGKKGEISNNKLGKFITQKEIKQFFGKRKNDVSKTDFGHALIVAGSRGMTGAAVLAARAALRMGIGLVTVACPESVYPIIAAQVAELMTLPLPETEKQSLSFLAFSQIKDFIARRKISVLAVGPGLSTHPETKKLVKNLLSLELPIILDADGINALAEENQKSRLSQDFSGQAKFKIQNLIETKAKIIITPHPGEFSRLLNEDKGKIQKNRIVYAKNFAQENKIVCVLKSYHTIITDGEEVFVNPTGNPGMATAGSGDVLTGMIAGLIPQITNYKLQITKILLNAAKIGVYLHGMAGDLAAKEKTEISLIAGDIIEKIPEAIKIVTKL